MTLEYLKQRLNPQALESKLNYINLRWGVDKDFVASLMDERNGHLLDGLTRGPKRKFRKSLRGLDRIFTHLSKQMDITDRFEALSDTFLQEYHNFIQSTLGTNEFNEYLAGNWNDRILSVVNVAQKRFMVPERIRTSAEQNPRARFAPRPQYSTDFNR